MMDSPVSVLQIQRCEQDLNNKNIFPTWSFEQLAIKEPSNTKQLYNDIISHIIPHSH